MVIVYILAFIGLLLAFYGVSIDKKVKGDNSYKPVCDISDKSSCSKAIKSPYSSMFGFSNALLGVIYFAIIIFLQAFGFTGLVFYLSLLGSLFAIYLAFVLFTRVKTFCIVCISSYCVIFLLFIFSWYQVWGA